MTIIIDGKSIKFPKESDFNTFDGAGWEVPNWQNELSERTGLVCECNLVADAPFCYQRNVTSSQEVDSRLCEHVLKALYYYASHDTSDGAFMLTFSIASYDKNCEAWLKAIQESGKTYTINSVKRTAHADDHNVDSYIMNYVTVSQGARGHGTETNGECS